ncbi:MAG: hypothetical protein ACRD10_09525, partial [Terriglobia bacterium]
MKKIDVPSIVLLGLLLSGVCFWLFGPIARRAQTAAAQTASQDVRNSQDSSSMPMPPKAPREFDFPYYSLRDGFESTMFLVNHSADALRLRIAIHGLDGEAADSKASIQPGQRLALSVRHLLDKQGQDAGGPFGEGNISIRYKGSMMAVVGQMSVVNSALSLIHESEMTENDPGMSDVPAALNGLWWGLGAGQEANVYVSNTAARPVIADVFLDFLGMRHASEALTFRGHETKVLSIAALLNAMNLSPTQAPEGGITIIGRGAPALIAEGAVMDPATGFSTTLHFLAPQVQLASTLVASGVPIGKPTKDSPYAGAGNFIPHVIVRNLADSPQQVTISIEYPHKKSFVHYDLPSLELGARSVEDVSLEPSLDELSLPLPFCSIRITYSGPPGSAVGEAASIERQ